MKVVMTAILCQEMGAVLLVLWKQAIRALEVGMETETFALRLVEMDSVMDSISVMMGMLLISMGVVKHVK
jgi:hypothetical protein